MPDVIVPASFNFPHTGKLLSLSFILFAGWFADAAVPLTDYPRLAVTGLLTFFGSLNVAVPFLLDFFRIPADTFQLVPGERRHQLAVRHARGGHAYAGGRAPRDLRDDRRAQVGAPARGALPDHHRYPDDRGDRRRPPRLRSRLSSRILEGQGARRHAPAEPAGRGRGAPSRTRAGAAGAGRDRCAAGQHSPPRRADRRLPGGLAPVRVLQRRRRPRRARCRAGAPSGRGAQRPARVRSARPRTMGGPNQRRRVRPRHVRRGRHHAAREPAALLDVLSRRDDGVCRAGRTAQRVQVLGPAPPQAQPHALDSQRPLLHSDDSRAPAAGRAAHRRPVDAVLCRAGALGGRCARLRRRARFGLDVDVSAVFGGDPRTGHREAAAGLSGWRARSGVCDIFEHLDRAQTQGWDARHPLQSTWILGQNAAPKGPRWSIIRNVLHWTR